MGRLALSSGLRHRAHAPAGVAEEWTPENIANLLIWIDPSDASTVTESSGDVVTIADKSASGSGLATPLAFTADADIQAAVIGTEGNGRKFLKTGSTTPKDLVYVPVGAPYNTNTVGGPTEQWLLVQVLTLGAPLVTSSRAAGLNRGLGHEGRAQFFKRMIYDDTSSDAPEIQFWISNLYTGTVGTAWTAWDNVDSPAPEAYNSKTFAIFARSFDDGGTLKIELSQDAQNWYIWDHGVTSTTTLSASNNKWSLSIYEQYAGDKWTWSGLGEQLFYGGSGVTAPSRADALEVYNYLDDKWGLDI